MSASPAVERLRPRPRLLVAGVIGGLALTCGVALTATSGWLIVRASERPVILTLLTAIVAVRAFGMARPALRYWERIRTHDAALADLAHRRTAAYAVLVPLTPARLGRRGRADLLEGVVDDLDDVVSAQIRVVVPSMGALVAAGATVALTAALDGGTALVLLALAAGVAAVSAAAWWIESRGQQALLEARAETARVAEMVANHAGEIRAVGGQDDTIRRSARADDILRAATLRQSLGRALATGLHLALGGLAAAVIALHLTGEGPWGGAPSTLEPAVRALLVLTPIALVDVFTPLADAMRALARSRAAAVRLHGLLDQDPAVTDPDGEGAPPRQEGGQSPTGRPAAVTAPWIRLEGVTATWTGDRTHLGPIDLDIPPGSRLAVTGANGSGKSTLLAVLARHLDPATGRYLVDDVDVRRLRLDDVRSSVAVVDDEPHVFASTVRENLRFVRPEGPTDDEIRGALARAGLAEWLDELPDGLDTRLGTGGRGVSGGERARLAVARAVLSERPVLLLDEPVAHLDHATALAVLDDLLAAADGRTVVMVSHRPDGLAEFDRVLDLTRSEMTW